MYKIIVVIVSFLLFSEHRTHALMCERYNETECKSASVEDCITTENCESSQHETSSTSYGCFALWQRQKDTSEERVKMKGCFLNSKECLGLDTCIGRLVDERNFTQTLYCCCQKDACNRHHEFDETLTTSTVKPQILPADHRETQTPMIVGIFGMIVLITLIVGVVIMKQKYFKNGLVSSDSGMTEEESILLEKSESSNALSVTLLEPKASGRFGKVWKASMAGKNAPVAAKILQIREKASWVLEQEVYSQYLMTESDFIVKFLGAKRNIDGDWPLWLVFEYLERGSLYDYLKGNYLKWGELLKIATTMCQGLAFIHEEIEDSKGSKPAIAHRDFKSKNVLLRSDLTACIADFGLAHIFYPNKPVGTSHGQVGTRRYMAPEVLEGAVTFTRDAFQRIDMYACGLVLWELTSRCEAQPGPISEYTLPFEEYVGSQPSLEEMQDIVLTQRKRPTIRNDWLMNPALSIIVDTMKDAWDHDAEARISASCIVERLNGLSNNKHAV